MAETLVQRVAAKMTKKHSFVTVNGKMGAAISNVVSSKYSLPFQF